MQIIGQHDRKAFFDLLTKLGVTVITDAKLLTQQAAEIQFHLDEQRLNTFF